MPKSKSKTSKKDENINNNPFLFIKEYGLIVGLFILFALYFGRHFFTTAGITLGTLITWDIFRIIFYITIIVLVYHLYHNPDLQKSLKLDKTFQQTERFIKQGFTSEEVLTHRKKNLTALRERIESIQDKIVLSSNNVVIREDLKVEKIDNANLVGFLKGLGRDCTNNNVKLKISLISDLFQSNKYQDFSLLFDYRVSHLVTITIVGGYPYRYDYTFRVPLRGGNLDWYNNQEYDISFKKHSEIVNIFYYLMNDVLDIMCLLDIKAAKKTTFSFIDNKEGYRLISYSVLNEGITLNQKNALIKLT